MKTAMDYQKQALLFLRRFDLHMTIRYRGTASAQWDDAGDSYKRHYHVKIQRPGGRTIQFPFWGAIADQEKGIAPNEYDVLACIGSDATGSTDPDEIVAELGPMKPSQAIAAARFTKRLQAFFTADELDALREIQ